MFCWYEVIITQFALCVNYFFSQKLLGKFLTLRQLQSSRILRFFASQLPLNLTRGGRVATLHVSVTSEHLTGFTSPLLPTLLG